MALACNNIIHTTSSSWVLSITRIVFIKLGYLAVILILENISRRAVEHLERVTYILLELLSTCRLHLLLSMASVVYIPLHCVCATIILANRVSSKVSDILWSFNSFQHKFGSVVQFIVFLFPLYGWFCKMTPRHFSNWEATASADQATQTFINFHCNSKPT